MKAFQDRRAPWYQRGLVRKLPRKIGVILLHDVERRGGPTALKPLGGVKTGFRSGRVTSSNVATWVLSNQDSNVAPQTLQVA